MMNPSQLEYELNKLGVGTKRAWHIANLYREVESLLTILSAPCCGPSDAELFKALRDLGLERKLQESIDGIKNGE